MAVGMRIDSNISSRILGCKPRGARQDKRREADVCQSIFG